MGIPATNKQISIRTMTVHRIDGGKVAEDWVLVESMGLFQQLGLLPPIPVLFSQAHVKLAASA